MHQNLERYILLPKSTFKLTGNITNIKCRVCVLTVCTGLFKKKKVNNSYNFTASLNGLRLISVSLINEGKVLKMNKLINKNKC